MIRPNTDYILHISNTLHAIPDQEKPEEYTDRESDFRIQHIMKSVVFLQTKKQENKL